MRYTFGKPMKEGGIKVVEITEHGKIGVTRRTKIELTAVIALLKPAFDDAYKEDG